jgi:hypothetical protein
VEGQRVGYVQTEEIKFPERSGDLVQHAPVAVAVGLVTLQGDRPVLAGRSTSTYLRREGAILQVRPPMQRPWPLRRGDRVVLRISKSATEPPLKATGCISWVRDRAFMPNGLAVSLVGITFDSEPRPKVPRSTPS